MAVIRNKPEKTASKPRKSAKKTKTASKPAPVPAPKQAKKKTAAPRGESAPPKNKGGHPRFKPTEDQRNVVMLAAAMGFTDKQACALVINPENGKPVSQPTLRQYFPDELEFGEARVLARVGGNLVSIASDRTHKGCVTAGIFIMKTRARWREPEPEWVERRRSFEAEQVTRTADGKEERIRFTLRLEENQPPLPPLIEATAKAA